MALSGPTAFTRRAQRVMLAIDVQRRGDLGRIAPVGQVQNDRRALDMMRRGRARAGERSQRGARFFGQGQRQCGDFARHTVSSGIAAKCPGFAAPPVVGSTGLEIRLARDQLQRLRQRQALEHTMPFAGMAVP